MLLCWLPTSFAALAARAGLRRFFAKMIATQTAATTVQKLKSASSFKMKATKIARATIAIPIANRFLARLRADLPGTKSLCRSWRVSNAGAGPGAGIEMICDQTADRLKLELTVGQSSCRNSMRALSFSMRHQGQLATCL